MPDDMLQIKVVVDQSGVAGAFTGVKAQVDGLSAGLRTAGAEGVGAGEKIAGGMRVARGEAMEAQHALRGVGEEIGVHVPRFVSSFISHMGGVAPVLASAFSVVAVVGIIQVIGELITKIVELSEKPELVAREWTKFNVALQADSESASKKLETMKTRFIELTQGPIAALDFQLKNVKVDFNEIYASEERVFSSLIKNVKESNLSNLNPMKWLDFMRDVPVSTANVSKLAQKIQDELVVALAAQDKKKMAEALSGGLVAAQKLLDDTQGAVNKAQRSGDVYGFSAYQPRLKAINELISALKEQQKAEQDVVAAAGVDASAKRAEIAIKSAEASRVQRKAEEEEKLRSAKQYDDANAQFELRMTTDVARIDKELADKQIDLWQMVLEGRQRIERSNTSVVEAELNAQLAAAKEQANERLSLAVMEKVSAPTQVRVAREGYEDQARIISQLVELETSYQATVRSAGLGEVQTVEKINASLVKQAALTRELNADWNNLQKVTQTTAEKTRQAWQGAITTIGSEFASSFTGFINGQETFGRSMQQLWMRVADTVVSALIRMAFQMIANAALGKAIDDSTKLSDAKTAAANTYKSASGIPLVGWLVAPAAAAAAFAAVMAFEKGGIVPQTGLAIVHKGEMVVPAHLTSQMARASASSSSGRNMTVNYNPHVSGINTSGIKDMLDEHGAVFASSLFRQFRRMNQ